MVLLLLPLSSFGGEDNACSTNANSSPTALAQVVCWALKAHASSDRPLLAGRLGSKDSKGDGGNNNGNADSGGQELDSTPDWDGPPPPPPLRHCDNNKGGRQVKAKATQRAIAIATRVASNN
jgi:hypothetical protein